MAVVHHPLRTHTPTSGLWWVFFVERNINKFSIWKVGWWPFFVYNFPTFSFIKKKWKCKFCSVYSFLQYFFAFPFQVSVRVRPLMDPLEGSCIQVVSNRTLLFDDGSKIKPKPYNYDYVFGEKASQVRWKLMFLSLICMWAFDELCCTKKW